MFDLIRKDVKETIDTEADVYKGEAFMSAAVYISGLLDLELKDHLKRDKYISFSTFIKAQGFYVEKDGSAEDDPNYRNASPPALTACVNKLAGGDIITADSALNPSVKLPLPFHVIERARISLMCFPGLKDMKYVSRRL